jgi:asparagine synthase (glutamine-hydrolysing)
LNYTPCPLTLVEGIEKLRPGHWLEWRQGEVRSQCFWRLPFGTNGPWTLESGKEQLDVLLRQSAKEHLLSDVPLGIWLSGGIDSSTILHYAAEASPLPLRTFSITFEGRTFDDGPYSERVAAHYGTRHEQMDLSDHSSLQDTIEEFAYYADDPNADAGALPVWFLSKLTRQNATVALSGEGADELFGGYLTYRADQLSRPFRHLPRSLVSLAANVASHWPPSDDKISFEYKLNRFFEGSQMPAARAHAFWNGTFSDAGKQELIRRALPTGLDPILSEIKCGGPGLKAFLWFDQKYFLADDILAKVDRISMAHSLEVRPPFLDHRIVEFAASLPMNLLVQGSRQKIILKELMRGKIPTAVLRRKKVGFDIPAHQWLRGPLRDFMTDTLREGASRYAELFQRPVIERCIQQHLGRTKNLGYHLWGLLILFLWMRRWRIEVRQPELASITRGSTTVAV